MKLLMYLGNDLIDSVCLEKKKVILPGYIRSFIRIFKEKHNGVISQSAKEPEFLVHDILDTDSRTEFEQRVY